MLYLLDANTLITAKNNYYPLLRFPDYWSWLIHMGQQDIVKVPTEIYGEYRGKVMRGGQQDELAKWAQAKATTDALLLKEEDVDHLGDVIERGYGIDIDDERLLATGKDPWLIAYALNDRENRIIVTSEVSKPNLQKQNRRIPDVCGDLNVRCIDSHRLISELDFYCDWRNRL